MWKDLTLEQKAEIMKMSVANGVTDINDIQQLYDGSVGHKFDKAGRIITLADLPNEYVQKYGHINVVTPKGVRMPLSQAYRDYNQTPINVNDVPGLTDYLIKQDNPDIQEQAHINKVAADRKVHQLGEERDKALIGLAAAITGGGALASGLALAPVATIGSTIGGITGEKVFNAGYEKLTGNNWGQDVERWTNGYIPAEYGEYLNPGTLIGGITGDVASKVGRKILNTAFLSRTMNKSLNLTEIPNSTQPLVPKYRTRLGDVEINDPNLMYHQKANTNTSMFGKSGTGSVLTDRGIIPGKSKLEGQQSYIWFNKGKPYVNKDSQYLVTTPSSNPNLIHVRSQNYPIGQWNGKTGFVTNNEYVSANPIEGTVYRFEPGYGYRKVGSSNPIEVVQNSAIQPITEKNALNTSNANWDWNRDTALFRGDKKELQRLRDLHFEVKAPNTKYKGVVYRGMDNNNPYIDMSKMQVSDTRATYVTPHKDYASFYSNEDSNVKSMYVNLENIWRDKLGKEYSFYDPEQLTRLIAKNTSKGNSERAAYLTDIYNSIKDADGMFRYRTGSALGPADFEAQVPPEILVRNNNALKLTNPITFDDFGNIIPLSKRDNFLSNDIRFANGGHLFDKGGSKGKKQTPKYQYGIIEQLLRENGVNFRVTSGARKPNQAGNAGKGSAHTYTIFGNSPGAIDIVPGVGSDWNTLFAQMNSPRVRKALAAYGLDVLNETNPSVMASTHATGPHLHVGRGIKGQTGMGQMFGGTSYGGGKGDMYAPTYGSRSSNRGYDSGYQNFTSDIEPITIESGNRDSGWLNYIASVNKPISFNTPIGATTLDSNLSGTKFTPTDFSMLDSDVEMVTPLNPTVAKRNMEYSLGLENNALWNSPYLLFKNS